MVIMGWLSDSVCGYYSPHCTPCHLSVPTRKMFTESQSHLLPTYIQEIPRSGVTPGNHVQATCEATPLTSHPTSCMRSVVHDLVDHVTDGRVGVSVGVYKDSPVRALQQGDITAGVTERYD